MFERLVIAIELIATALTAIANNASGLTPPVDAAAPAPAPSKRRTKAEIAADEAAAAAAAKTDTKVDATPVNTTVVDAKPAAAPAAAAAPAPTFDYEVLKTSVIELANSGAEGKAQAILLLGQYGVRKASDVAPEKWEELNGKMQKALAELQGAGNDFA